MKMLLTQSSTSSKIRIRSLLNPIPYQKPKLFCIGIIAFMMFMSIQVSGQNCDNWWDAKYLTLKSGIEDGDTIHTSSCQVPPNISRLDLVYYNKSLGRKPSLKNLCFLPTKKSWFSYKSCVKISTHRYSMDVPDDADADVYKFWQYEIRIINEYCDKEYKLTYYVAQHDHGAPTFQCFPRDTAVASLADLPPVSQEVKIIDFCQYGILDSLITEAVVDTATGDTVKFVRTWYASDPSGNTSSKSQMIWIDPDVSAESSALVNWSDVKIADWTLYPNPARNSIMININSDAELNYHIYDGLGRTIKTGTFLRGQAINLESLSPGIYNIRLQDDKNLTSGVKKFTLIE